MRSVARPPLPVPTPSGCAFPSRQQGLKARGTGAACGSITTPLSPDKERQSGEYMTGSSASAITIDELVERIKAGTRGPKFATFLDCESAAIEGYSAGAFSADRVRNLGLGTRRCTCERSRPCQAVPLPNRSSKALCCTKIRSAIGHTEEPLLEVGYQISSREVGGSVLGARRLVGCAQTGRTASTAGAPAPSFEYNGKTIMRSYQREVVFNEER